MERDLHRYKDVEKNGISLVIGIYHNKDILYH